MYIKIFNRNISLILFNNKLCNIAKMNSKKNAPDIIDLTTMDDCNDFNSETATAATTTSVSFDHNGIHHSPSRNRILQELLHANRNSGPGYREESTILNENQFHFPTNTNSFFTNVYGYGNQYCGKRKLAQQPPTTNSSCYQFNYAQKVMNLKNNSNVSFNSSQQSSSSSSDAKGTTTIHQDLVKQQEIVLNKIRKWIPVSTDNNSTGNDGLYFTLLNYNVLAQDLVQENPYLYKNHSPRACIWETRWKNLYKEITSYNADIICLQEVQESHLKNYYSQFERIGYVGLYKKRTGMRPDGCAIYYRKSIFKLLENTTVEFNQGTNTLDRENVAIIARLASKQNPASEFVVATTHLLYNPRRMDVRLTQTQVLLAEIERISYNNKENNYAPIIITGDFNSKPDSAVYEFIINGTLKYEHLTNRTLTRNTTTSSSTTGKTLISPHLMITDNSQHYEIIKLRKQGIKLTRAQELSLINLRHSKRKHFPNNEYEQQHFVEDPNIFATGTLSHQFHLLSAFKHIDKDDFEATTHQNEWITVDYIFYSGKYNKTTRNVSEDKLILIEKYRIPNTLELKEVKYIPNFVIGSDHLPLLLKFKLKN